MSDAYQDRFAGRRARTTQEERSQRTRGRLADAAIECLVDSGYRGTTFVEVCRRAGLTRGAAHHHYRDMPDLLVDTLARLHERLLARARPVLGIDEFEKRVDAGIDVLWELFTAPEFKAVVEIWVAQSHDPDLQRRIRSELDRCSELITEGFVRSFPELADEASDAIMIMRFALLVVLGMGFLNATVSRDSAGPERERMLQLLKDVVQREVTFMRMSAAGGR